jgi:hypothetical protein
MRDMNTVQQNLDQARQRLIQAKTAIERARALADILKYEYLLSTADN